MGRRPIKPADFKAALRATCGATVIGRSTRPIGIAVSGGVDSMALACLCKSVEQQSHGSLRFKALIVDHMARDNSSEEVQHTAATIRKLGLPVTILKLQWDDVTQPLKLSNFEAQARRKRYRAIGLACKNLKIQSLLVAHHSDDQAETVVMRIVDNRVGLGLRAMKQGVDLPECHDIAGVHSYLQESSDYTRRYRAFDNRPTREIASAGIKLYRPLLGFPKERLIATCQSFNVPWIEDETNYDKTLTVRNSVRYLLAGERLPIALRKVPLLRLAGTTQDKEDKYEQLSHLILDKIDFQHFDTRSGKLTFISSPSRNPFLLDQDVISMSTELGLDLFAVAYIVVRKIASIVSPYHKISKENLAEAVQGIFPGLNNIIGNCNSPTNPLSYTAAGIHWYGVPVQTEAERPQILWTLTRQPYVAAELKPQLTWTTEPTATSDSGGEPGSWQLFDGRFWIRAVADSGISLCARPFREAEAHNFKSSLGKEKRNYFDRVLAEAAPGKSRWTLPALVEQLDGPVLALPTLGIHSDKGNRIQWNTIYKRIEIPRRLRE